jgi:DNA-binding NarL/FixJ family response regulator
MKIAVVIIDDHRLIREMWSTLLEGNSEFEIAGTFEGIDEAVEMIKINKPDLVLLDINLAKGSGIDAVPLIKKFSPGTKIIAISMHNQPAYAKKMLNLGATGYLTKNSSQEEFFKAIEMVMQGKTYLCSEMENIMSVHALDIEKDGPDINELSLREIEIARLIRTGLSSKEIATRLEINVRTVEAHRRNILIKLKLKNTAMLINYINTTDLPF